LRETVDALSPHFGRLQSLSAAVDAGTRAGAAWDIDSNARPLGSRPDIGASELVQGTFWKAQ